MSFMMKTVLAKVKVAKDLFGVPASFFVVGSQQLVSFSIMLTILAVARLIGRPLTIKKLKKNEIGLVLALSVAFSMNIGLNLLSLSLIPLSLVMIIRACSPITTGLMQTLILKEKQAISGPEWACLFAGVVCAAVVTLAESSGGAGIAAASKSFWWGVSFAVSSLMLGGLDFVIKAKLGSGPKLNALETNLYNAIPVAIFTCALGSVLPTPVPPSWSAHFAPYMTDLQVFKGIFQVNPAVLLWVVGSGVAAFVFNLFVTFLVVKLSPATGSFAGNFNKSASIILSLLWLEGARPNNARGVVKICAVLGNIVAFACYNVLKKKRQKK
ncbi:unnamed protein product [Effrenium voratum]|nr:unnamed protein product [Effrenium voratum]